MKNQPTKQQLGRMIEILKECRQHLWDGTKTMPGYRNTTTYICFAIERITPPDAKWGEAAYVEEYKLRNAVKDAIHRGLNRISTFDNYLHCKGVAVHSMRYKQIQALRLAWVNQMIADWTKIWGAME